MSFFGRSAAGAKAKERSSGSFPADRPVDEARDRANDDGTAALDALGAVLQTLGRVSFDLDDEPGEAIRATFDRLARHVLIGGSLAEAPEGGAKAPEGMKRDWGAIRRTVQSHRKREVAYVVKALDDLRRAVGAFTAAFARVTGEDGKADVLVRQQLARLDAAAKESDTGAISREALATVAVVGDSIDKRVARHRAELRDLSTHVRHLSDQLEQAKRDGATDGLTRVPNRACFDAYLVRAVDLAALSTGDLYLMMIDVDRFKQTNDAHGHGAGDAALKAVADRLSRTFPRRGDLVARYGGDEFAVILRDVRADEARMLAERIVVAVRGTCAEHQGQKLPLSVSVGLAARKEGDTPEAWVARADAALYAAKQAGRDRWSESPGSPSSLGPGAPTLSTSPPSGSARPRA